MNTPPKKPAKADVLVAIYQDRNHPKNVFLCPCGRTTDGGLFLTDIGVRSDGGSADQIGAACLQVLRDYCGLALDKPRTAFAGEPQLGDNLKAWFGYKQTEEAVLAVRCVNVSQYGSEIDIQHTDAYDGRDPGYRSYRQVETLNAPDAAELGGAILMAFERCTININL